MKRIFSVVILCLALNFLALAGGVGWLYQNGHLDKDRFAKIRGILFPPPAPPPAKPSSNANAATTQPTLQWANLTEKLTGRPATEQIDFIKRTFDAQMLELDLRQRELLDLQRQVDLANQKLAADRAALEKRENALAQREQEADQLDNDKGFQDSLALYKAMAPAQVKQIFLTLSQQTVQQYLQAMEPRTAGKIIKEFKTPDETAFIQKVLEGMRQTQTQPPPQASASQGNGP
jgi:flagellar motility protein MotE (MotC chaperone)